MCNINRHLKFKDLCNQMILFAASNDIYYIIQNPSFTSNYHFYKECVKAIRFSMDSNDIYHGDEIINLTGMYNSFIKNNPEYYSKTDLKELEISNNRLPKYLRMTKAYHLEGDINYDLSILLMDIDKNKNACKLFDLDQLAVKMTKEDIEEILGYKIEIVDNLDH